MKFALRFHVLAALFTGGLMWTCVGATPDWPDLKFTVVAGGATLPTDIAAPRDGTGRLFVTEQTGRILVMQGGVFTPFLNLEDRVRYFEFRELGLLNVAFPPGFASNHHFYVFYNSLPNGDATISRFSVSATNANVADAASEQKILTIPYPEAPLTLSGGQLLFGPDNLLYAGIGDSGFDLDYPNGAQNPQSIFGKILRIDVENSANGYQVPADNPFVGNPAYLPEIWAMGVRNPWRFCFDSFTGDFFMGDVGQFGADEVNFKPAAVTAGQNYGWPAREGNHLYAGPDGPASSYRDPIVEVLHTNAVMSITGGNVYRGPGPNRLTGVYIYADAYNGTIWGVQRDGANWLNQQLAQLPYFITSLGEDEAGRLYCVDYFSGQLFQMEDSGQVAAPTFEPAGTNSYSDLILVRSLSTNVIIRYTTNGTDPGPGDAIVSSGGSVLITSGTTLKARAFRSGLQPSVVTATTYQLKAARPTFVPAQGPVTNGQPISLVCATPGVTMRVTFDGSEPGQNSMVYAGPIPYSNSMLLRARAFRTGFGESAVSDFSPAPFRIESVAVIGPGSYTTLTCTSQTNRMYQLQIADDVTQWHDQGISLPGTGGTLTFRNSLGVPYPVRRHYRVKVTDSPGF